METDGKGQTKKEEQAIEEQIEEKTVAEEYVLTAYCACEKCCGKWANNRPIDESGKPIVYTASGAVAVEGVTIATDKNKIPLGTKVYIDGLGERIAQDTGSSIKGNKIDVFFEDHQIALEFGRQIKKVKILN